MALEDLRNKWSVSDSNTSFEQFLYNELCKKTELLYECIEAIHALAYKIERKCNTNMNVCTNDNKVNVSQSTKSVQHNIEERMFGKIVCTGLCEKCKNRDGRSCLVSSRFGTEKPSTKQVKYAESIAQALNVSLPLCKKKMPYSSFISSMKNEYDVNRANRIWQTDF